MFRFRFFAPDVFLGGEGEWEGEAGGGEGEWEGEAVGGEGEWEGEAGGEEEGGLLDWEHDFFWEELECFFLKE